MAQPHTAPFSTPALSQCSTPPQVVADPNRRSLHRTEWIQEFFNTTTSPVGHGFNLVSSNPNYNLVPASERAGFACYSFVPKSNIPLKVIVLDEPSGKTTALLIFMVTGFLTQPLGLASSRTCGWSGCQSADDHCGPYPDCR